MKVLAAMVLSLIPTVTDAQSSADEQTIRRLRAASNAAIARHDTLGFGAAMAENIVLVTSRSSRTVGRALYITALARQFADQPDVVYERKPGDVTVFAPWGMASEKGRWDGSWTETDGKIRIGGSYFAKWRKVNGTWLIESETYVPEECTGGAYCRTPPG